MKVYDSSIADFSGIHMFIHVYVHSVRHKRFVSDLSKGLTLYVSSICLSDDSTDALHVLKAGLTLVTGYMPRWFTHTETVILVLTWQCMAKSQTRYLWIRSLTA